MLEELSTELGIDRERLADPHVKAALRPHTDAAIADGVFGVPTFVVDAEPFWCADSTDFIRVYLVDSTILASEEMRRVSALTVGAARA